MLVIAVFIAFLIVQWAFILIYYRQRKEIELLKKQLRARPKPKDNNDGLHPDIKALAKELNISYERAEEIYKRSKIID